MLTETFYHVYNHANGDENLFRSEENYHYFLRQWAKYIEPIASSYAYCLMPNHFHFLIKTHNLEQPFGKFETFQKFASKQFSNLFSSYTQAFNKMYNRRGSLFIPNFKRKEITSDEYLTAVIVYIHRNPLHHGFTKDIKSWPYSSYEAFLVNKPTRLKRQAVKDWFGTNKSYLESHDFEIKLSDHSLLIDW